MKSDNLPDIFTPQVGTQCSSEEIYFQRIVHKIQSTYSIMLFNSPWNKKQKTKDDTKWETWALQMLFTFLCLNIEKANERITDPKNPIRTSPAPGLDETFVR